MQFLLALTAARAALQPYNRINDRLTNKFMNFIVSLFLVAVRQDPLSQQFADLLSTTAFHSLYQCLLEPHQKSTAYTSFATSSTTATTTSSVGRTDSPLKWKLHELSQVQTWHERPQRIGMVSSALTRLMETIFGKMCKTNVANKSHCIVIVIRCH